MPVSEPLLEFKQRKRLTCVEELRGDRRSRAVAGNAPTRVFESDASFSTEDRNKCRVAEI